MRRHLNDPEIFRKRKRRTIIEPMIKSTLEAAYRECQRPTAMQIGAVADTLQLEREVKN